MVEIFFISDNDSAVGRFDLSTPNEFSTHTLCKQIIFSSSEEKGFAMSTDGTKIYSVDYTIETPIVTTYQLPGPFDISSKTQIHQVDLTDSRRRVI